MQHQKTRYWCWKTYWSAIQRAHTSTVSSGG